MKDDQPNSPRFAYRILRQLIDEKWQDEILGDLQEQYVDNQSKHRLFARLVFWWEAFRFIRHHVLRKPQKLNAMLTSNHIKISYRNLIRNKVYSGINIIGLSIGIASIVLIGIYINFETSYDKYYKDSDRIYRVALNRIYPTRTKDFGTSAINLSTVLKTNYPQVEEATRLHRLFFQNEIPVEIVEEEKTFIETRFLFADSLFFNVFSHKFLHGDPRTCLDDAESVVLSESTAIKYFGKTDILDKTINWGEASFKVTGVFEDIPDNSHIHFDLLGSISFLNFLENAIRTDNWTSPWVYTYIKLKTGADPSSLEEQFEEMVDRYGHASIASGVGANWKENGHAFEYFLQPLGSIHLHSQLDVEVEPNGNISYIYVLAAIAFFILAISSINFINLSIARSTERAKEVGIRKVLGSYRSSLINQFLIESILTCLLASTIGIAILYFFIPDFNDYLGTHLTFGVLSNPLVIAVVVGFIFLIGILAGLYPAVSFSSLRPTRILKGSYKSSEGGLLLRNVLITFQFLISIVMISGSIIAEQQMTYLRDKNLGFDKDNLLVIKQSHNVQDNYQAFLNNVGAIVGVERLGNASTLPGQFHGSQVYVVNDPEIPDIRVNTSSVDDNYIDAIGFNMIEGRKFSEEFNDSLSIIVNEATLRAMGVEKAVGYKFRSGTRQEQENPEFTIVGVVEDYHFYSLHNEVSPMVIFNIQPGNVAINTIVRINSPNTSLVITQIEEKWSELTEAEFNFAFLDQELQRQYESDKNTASMFNIFTYIAIIMSCTGLFGLATYVVNQRSKEMSIRKVLGASIPHIIGVFTKQFMILIGLAFVIGTPLAYLALTQWLDSFAYHITIGVLTFVLAGLVTITLVFLTVSHQAVKLARVNPVKMLRSE